MVDCSEYKEVFKSLFCNILQEFVWENGILLTSDQRFSACLRMRTGVIGWKSYL